MQNLSEAKIMRRGPDVTVVGWGAQLKVCPPCLKKLASMLRILALAVNSFLFGCGHDWALGPQDWSTSYQ